MKQEVIDALSFYGIKKSKLESDLGMPKNSLSAMLSGSKEIPKKWVDVLRKYVDDLNNPQKDLETPKEAQIKPEIEKTVESTQIPIEACTMHDKEHTEPLKVGSVVTEPVVYEKGNEKVILASVIESNFGNIVKVSPILLGGDANSRFDQLLKQFNDLVDLTEKPKDIKLKLEQIKESAKLSNLTPRQTDAIVDRVNHLLNGKYNQAKHNLKLS